MDIAYPKLPQFNRNVQDQLSIFGTFSFYYEPTFFMVKTTCPNYCHKLNIRTHPHLVFKFFCLHNYQEFYNPFMAIKVHAKKMHSKLVIWMCSQIVFLEHGTFPIFSTNQALS
jgi:hypothetical protein